MTLRTAFKGAEIYPFLDAMSIAMRNLVLSGNREKTLEAGSLAAELYPATDFANGAYGVALLWSGDKKMGEEHLQKALAINPSGFASARNLNGLAYSLAEQGNAEGGLQILMSAVILHPKEANLYDSIGEFHWNKGNREKAIEFYKKALEIDPQLQSAKNMLEKIMNTVERR